MDEHEIVIDKIRNLLNKLTKKNYNEIKEEIIIEIKHFSYSRNNIVLVNMCKKYLTSVLSISFGVKFMQI